MIDFHICYFWLLSSSNGKNGIGGRARVGDSVVLETRRGDDMHSNSIEEGRPAGAVFKRTSPAAMLRQQ